MTTPSSYPLTILEITQELNLNYPAQNVSLTHPWILALAGKSAPPISFSDLLGKSGNYQGNGLSTTSGGQFPTWTANFPPGYNIFGGSLASLAVSSGPNQFILSLNFNSPPFWSGNFLVDNISTGGTTAILPKVNGTTWQSVYNGPTNPWSNIVRGTTSVQYNDYYNIYPN